MYARMAHKTPFVVYQGAWSVLQRDFERDIIPMARQEGWYRPAHSLKRRLIHVFSCRNGSCALERARSRQDSYRC